MVCKIRKDTTPRCLPRNNKLNQQQQNHPLEQTAAEAIILEETAAETIILIAKPSP